MKQTIRRRYGSSAACCFVLSHSSIQKHAFANIARIFDLQNSANFNTIPLFLCTFLPDWYATFQAFGIFGFVGINLAMFLVVLAMFVDSCKGNAEVKMAATILCFVAGKLPGGPIESAMGVGGGREWGGVLVLMELFYSLAWIGLLSSVFDSTSSFFISPFSLSLIPFNFYFALFAIMVNESLSFMFAFVCLSFQ